VSGSSVPGCLRPLVVVFSGVLASLGDVWRDFTGARGPKRYVWVGGWLASPDRGVLVAHDRYFPRRSPPPPRPSVESFRMPNVTELGALIGPWLGRQATLPECGCCVERGTTTLVR
jgi:hypothetical protein